MFLLGIAAIAWLGVGGSLFSSQPRLASASAAAAALTSPAAIAPIPVLTTPATTSPTPAALPTFASATASPTVRARAGHAARALPVRVTPIALKTAKPAHLPAAPPATHPPHPAPVAIATPHPRTLATPMKSPSPLPATARAPRASAVPVALASSAPASTVWSGDFSGYDSSAWLQIWGAPTIMWNPSYAHSEPDATAPGIGDALHVRYDAGAGSPGCIDCGAAKGGVNFATFLKYSSRPALDNQTALYLQYSLKFPVGFDWGGGGHLPGLFGGVGRECVSGISHCTGAWSTRLKWGNANGERCETGASCSGALDIFNGCERGSGRPVGRGSWQFSADGKWHTIEQFVDTTGMGQAVLWYDGNEVVRTTIGCLGNNTITGILFQSTYTGKTTTMGPTVPTDNYFSAFQIGTAKL